MTTDDIIRLAREANLGNVLCHNSVEGDRVFIEGADWHDELERFAALVAAAEQPEPPPEPIHPDKIRAELREMDRCCLPGEMTVEDWFTEGVRWAEAHHEIV